LIDKKKNTKLKREYIGLNFNLDYPVTLDLLNIIGDLLINAFKIDVH